MKSVLSLALVCYFVAGALAGGCDCDIGMFECACKNANDEVIKAKILSEGVPSSDYFRDLGNGLIYRVKTITRYLEHEQWAPWDVRYVYISYNCNKTLKKDERYILMGKYNLHDINGAMVMELHSENALAKVIDNVDDSIMKKLRQLRDGIIECP